jgi:rRNA processing protein Gar1
MYFETFSIPFPPPTQTVTIFIASHFILHVVNMNISFVTVVSAPKYIGTNDVKGTVKNVFCLIKQRVTEAHGEEDVYIYNSTPS